MYKKVYFCFQITKTNIRISFDMFSIFNIILCVPKIFNFMKRMEPRLLKEYETKASILKLWDTNQIIVPE